MICLLRCVLPLKMFNKSKEILSEIADVSYIVYKINNTELIHGGVVRSKLLMFLSPSSLSLQVNKASLQF